MKAVYLTGIRKIELRNVPRPSITGPGQVLLRIETVGVCGSDMHYFRTGRIGDQVVEFPWILGHECSGTVVETGAGVTQLMPGQRVAVDPLIWCHRCDQCLSGREHTCRNQKFLGCPGQVEGCLAEYLAMPAESCFALPGGMDSTEASLVEPMAIGLYSQRLAGDMRGMKVGILGAGPIGLCILLACRLAGAETIYVTEIRDNRAALAGRMGADWTGNPHRQDIVADILARAPLGLDVVFEAAGEQSTLDEAAALSRPGGKVLMVGIPEADRVSFEIASLRRREITIQPVRRQNRCVEDTIRLVSEGQLKVRAMVTHEFPLERTRDAFETVADYRDNVVKAMIHVCK